MKDIEEVKYALQNRISVSPEDLTRDILRAAGCMDRVCVLPAQLDERVSYLGDVLVQMLTRTPKDDQLRATVGQLTQALSYMLNSSSWRDGELHDFDRAELQNKLGRLINR